MKNLKFKDGKDWKDAYTVLCSTFLGVELTVEQCKYFNQKFREMMEPLKPEVKP